MAEELRNDFPILHRGGGTKLAYPSVLLYEHEAQAKKNHDGQSLATLKARGGLSVQEMVAIMEDRDWTPMGFTEAYERLCEIAQARASATTGGGK